MYGTPITDRGNLSEALDGVCNAMDDVVMKMNGLVKHLTELAHDAERKALDTRQICVRAKQQAERTETSVKNMKVSLGGLPELHAASKALYAYALKVVRGEWTFDIWQKTAALALVCCSPPLFHSYMTEIPFVKVSCRHTIKYLDGEQGILGDQVPPDMRILYIVATTPVGGRDALFKGGWKHVFQTFFEDEEYDLSMIPDHCGWDAYEDIMIHSRK